MKILKIRDYTLVEGVNTFMLIRRLKYYNFDYEDKLCITYVESV